MHAEEFKNIRVELGLTQQDFAAEIGASVSAVANWENIRSSIPKWAALAARRLKQNKEE